MANSYSLRHGMWRCLTCVSMVLLTAMTAKADGVTQAAAEQTARDFLAKRGKAVPAKLQRKRVPQQKTADGELPTYYVFSGEDAFVIVAGETEVRPVLAYSLTHTLDPEHMAPGTRDLLQWYEAQIAAVRAGAPAMAPKTRNLGEGVLLTTAEWNQNYNFWWNYCPVVNGKQTLAGCGATAMAILMRYYEWPQHGWGGNSYTTTTLGIEISENFENTDYDLADLPLGNQWDRGWTEERKDRVAKLLYHCGVSVNMDYTPNWSASWGYDIALYRHFGYTLGSWVDMNPSEGGDIDRWIAIAKDELENDHPLIYMTWGEDGGHAYICDGYDADGALHFNMGWSGYGNGYYYVDHISPSAANGDYFSQNHRMCLGIQPNYDYDGTSQSGFVMHYYPYTQNGESECGLRCVEGEPLIPGNTYCIRAYNLINYSQLFSGHAELFLCERSGKPKQRLTDTGTHDLEWGSGWHYLSFYVSIPPSAQDTDVIGLFTRDDREEDWKLVECAKKEYTYLPINREAYVLPVPGVPADSPQNNTNFYTLDGKTLKEKPSRSRIYILRQGTKTVKYRTDVK